jgi:hypothetical protein
MIYRWWDHQGGRMFHNNFWPNLELGLQTGRFVEKEYLIPMRKANVPLVMRLGPEVGKEPAADTAAIVGFLRERLGNRIRTQALSQFAYARHLRVTLWSF